MKKIYESILEALKPIIEVLHTFYLLHFLAGLGIFASLLNWFVPDTHPAGHILDALVLSVFAAIIVVSVYIYRKIKSTKIIVFGAEPKNRKYYVEIDPSEAEIRAGLIILHDHFAQDVIPDATFMKAKAKNQNCIVIVKTEGDEIVAIGDYHGLEESIFNKFIAGDIAEKDIDPVSFLTKTELARSSRFYLGGISVHKKSKSREGEISQAAIKGILAGLCSAYRSEKRQDRTKIDIYALGYTRKGRRSLEANGFFQDSNRTEKRSAPMYARSTTVRQLRHLKTQPPVGAFQVIILNAGHEIN